MHKLLGAQESESYGKYKKLDGMEKISVLVEILVSV